MTGEQRAALEAAVRSAEARAPAGTRLVALGWSSVESERTERAVGGMFEEAADDVLLGARCRIATDVVSVPLVVLEPRTEGPIAASLARHGEGPAVAWYTSPSGAVHAPGPISDGPFGPESRPKRDGDDRSIVLLVTARTATIAT